MRGMRTQGTELSTDFGELRASSGVELPLARIQKNAIEKEATYFDKYNLRVTITQKAGDADVNYSRVLDALSAADIPYREVRRYSIEPDRVMLDILVQNEDIDIIKELNKLLKDQNISLTINDNVPEDISPRVITTPEKELDEPIKVEASKKVAVSDELMERARQEIEEGTDTAYDVAADAGQIFGNVKHMQWFVEAVAEELATTASTKLASEPEFDIGDMVRIVGDDQFFNGKEGEITDSTIEKDKFDPAGNEPMILFKIEGDGIDADAAESWVDQYSLEKID